jgi:hypothetical protein
MALFLPWNECQNVRRTSEPPVANAKRRRYKRKTLELRPSCAHIRLGGEMSEQSAASRDIESGRKNRASARKTRIEERGEKRRDKRPSVSRRQRCRLHDALSRKTARHRTTCTVFPSRIILVNTIQKTRIYICIYTHIYSQKAILQISIVKKV